MLHHSVMPKYLKKVDIHHRYTIYLNDGTNEKDIEDISDNYK